MLGPTALRAFPKRDSGPSELINVLIVLDPGFKSKSQMPIVELKLNIFFTFVLINIEICQVQYLLWDTRQTFKNYENQVKNDEEMCLNASVQRVILNKNLCQKKVDSGKSVEGV